MRTIKTRPFTVGADAVEEAEAEANARLANARLIAKASLIPELVHLAQHVLAMADDAYLIGHPEWVAIVTEARTALTQATEVPL